MSKHLIAFFSKEADAQRTLNELTEAGLSTDNLSMIMLDNKDSNKKMLTPYDENDEMAQGEGVINPLDAESTDLSSFTIPGIGEIIVAGALSKNFEDEELELNNEVKQENDYLYNILDNLQVEKEDIHTLQNRIKNGEILITIPVEDDNKEEITLIFTDNDGDIIDQVNNDLI